MSLQPIVWEAQPALERSTLIIGLTGWMDGSEVSSGTVSYMIKDTEADLMARIRPEPFYVYQLPGPVDFANAFRPYVEIEDGLILDYKEPADLFFADPSRNLLFFLGKEPHLNWRDFADCVLHVCEQAQVERIFFVGSVAGLVPHTRQPRFTCLVSDESLKPALAAQNLKFTDYNGPSSIVSYLVLRAQEAEIPMVSLIAEIPAYIQGKNPKCIEAVLRRLTSLLPLELDLSELKETAEDLEAKISKLVSEREDLAEHIQLLEENYDKEVFDTEMTDLKDWLEQKGIRLD